MQEQPIIEAVDRELIEAELTQERFLRTTNKAGNEIYIVNAHNSPNIMREIGRLREIAFRTAGGGTGLEVDIDQFDTMDSPCEQLIVWNPDAREIIGGYRFILGENIQYNSDGQPHIATSHLFRFSKKFINNYMPYTIELGRSFVAVEYQSSQAGAKSLYALDNLWDGLGALTVKYPHIRYFFGKFTMYPTFNRTGRDMILFYLKRHFGDRQRLVVPHNPLRLASKLSLLQRLFPLQAVKDNYKILNREVRALGENIPPLVNAYMNLSATMKVFGTAINDEFGDVEETGILITVKDIYEEKRERHIISFVQNLKENLKIKQIGIK
ncbi:MAG: GNAT family N-acetyltransferase [Paludibacteraceae bacterium]|nr:GNAT family N-acetyltransferase [Paludibacteraceae bacterium]